MAFVWNLSPCVGSTEPGVFCVGGDELQLPPVPMQASLLAPLGGCSDEYKAGVAIFAGFKHVYRLTTAMRFVDRVLAWKICARLVVQS